MENIIQEGIRNGHLNDTHGLRDVLLQLQKERDSQWEVAIGYNCDMKAMNRIKEALKALSNPNV